MATEDLDTSRDGHRGSRGTAPTGPSGWQVLMVLVAGWVIAVSMPLIDLLGRNGAFLVAHDLQGGRLVAYLALLVVVVPVVLALPLLVLRRFDLGRRVALTVAFAAFLAAVLLTFGTQLTSLPGVPLVITSVIVAGLLAPKVVGSAAGRRGLVVLGVLAPTWVVVQFLFLSPAGALISTGETEVSATTGGGAPVFLLMLDEFPLTSLLTPEGDIDGELFPTFAELAETTTWFPRATTYHRSTERVVPSILTGRESTGKPELPVASAYPGILFELLGDRDILTVEPITDLCAVENCRTVEAETEAVGASPWRAIAVDTAVVYLHQVLPEDLAARLPSIDEGWGGFLGEDAATTTKREDGGTEEGGADEGGPDEQDAEELTEELHEEYLYDAVWSDSSVAARAYIDSIATATPTSFYFGHVMLPHSPWTHLPNGDRVVAGHRSEPARLVGGGGVWVDNEWLLTHMYMRHLLQAQFTDVIVGEFVDAVQATGLWDEAIVVVISDHGVTFRPELHRRDTQTDATAADVLHIPLFIKFPGQTSGVRSEVAAGVTDVAPTIAEVLQISPRPDYEGQVLRQSGGPAPTGDDGFSEVLASAARKYELFDLDGGAGLYGFGRDADLLGTEVAAQAQGGPADVEVTLVDRAALEEIVPREGFSPALVEGSLSGAGLGEVGPSGVAIALDGTIVGVAEPFVREGEVRFQTLLDPAYLTPGPHELDVYTIDDRGGQRVLSSTTLL